MANNFGTMTDHFAFASSTNGLELIASSDGRTNEITETAELCVINARDVGNPYMNPKCDYAITKAYTISLTLGGMYNGIMLCAVELRTHAGQPPTLSLFGVENEGSAAIQTHAVSIALVPRSKAYSPLAALNIPNNARLVDCVTTWTAEPVLVIDKNNIIASDIQHGRVDVAATVIATSTNFRPSAATGFNVRAAASLTASDAAYRMHNIVVTKTLT